MLELGIAREIELGVLALALALSVLVGVSLGLLGGGGSILTVPVLQYVAGLPSEQAIAASLFVVAVTSAAAVIPHARAGRVLWRTGLVFGAAGMAGAYPGGLVSGALPPRARMLAFVAVMGTSAVGMLRRPGGRLEARLETRPPREPALGGALARGFSVGVLTGVLGVGGGVVIVPTMVLLGGLPMDRAVGTSLVAIAMSAAAGLLGHLRAAEMVWPPTLAVAAAAIAGAWAGGRLVARVDPRRLRRGFGAMILGVAAAIVVGELAGG